VKLKIWKKSDNYKIRFLKLDTVEEKTVTEFLMMLNSIKSNVPHMVYMKLT